MQYALEISWWQMSFDLDREEGEQESRRGAVTTTHCGEVGRPPLLFLLL